MNLPEYCATHSFKDFLELIQDLDIKSQGKKIMENDNVTNVVDREATSEDLAILAINTDKLKELEELNKLDPETDGEILGYVQSETDYQPA